MDYHIMGRRPKSLSDIERTKSFYESEALKSKHRYADTKYRSKVQFLYGKVREMVQVKTTKDALLNDALKFILSKENDICTVIGENGMRECKLEFLRFLRSEDKMWKSEKTLERWWSKVEVSLNKKYSIQEPVKDENADFEGLCFEHSREWASQPSEFRKFTDYAPYSLYELANPKCSMLIEGLECTESTLSNSSKENLKDPVYTPNSMWSPTDTSNLVPNDTKGFSDLSLNARNAIHSPDACFYSVENPLEVSEPRMVMDNSELNNTGFITGTFVSL